MKNVIMGILSVIIGLLLWLVCSTLIAGLFLLIAKYVEPLVRLIAWIERSDALGHIIPVIFRGLPCVLPAWVIYKLCSGSCRTTIASEVITAVIIFGTQVYGYIVGSGSLWWLIQGAIGIFMAFGAFAMQARRDG